MGGGEKAGSRQTGALAVGTAIRKGKREEELRGRHAETHGRQFECRHHEDVSAGAGIAL